MRIHTGTLPVDAVYIAPWAGSRLSRRVTIGEEVIAGIVAPELAPAAEVRHG